MTSQENAPEAVIGRAGSYEKGVARRQEILDRAIEVFRERGAGGTSLRSIAQSIGVSHAALLHYFDSREQLLVAVYERAEGTPSNEFFSARFARIRDELTQRLTAEQAAGRLRGDVEPADMAALLIAASDGLQIQWLLEPSVQLERTLETFSILLAPTS